MQEWLGANQQEPARLPPAAPVPEGSEMAPSGPRTTGYEGGEGISKPSHAQEWQPEQLLPPIQGR